MSSRARSMVFSLIGFFAAAFVASIIHIEPWSKAAVVAIVSGLFSTLWIRLASPKGRSVEGLQVADNRLSWNSRLVGALQILGKGGRLLQNESTTFMTPGG